MRVCFDGFFFYRFQQYFRDCEFRPLFCFPSVDTRRLLQHFASLITRSEKLPCVLVRQTRELSTTLSFNSSSCRINWGLIQHTGNLQKAFPTCRENRDGFQNNPNDCRKVAPHPVAIPSKTICILIWQL